MAKSKCEYCQDNAAIYGEDDDLSGLVRLHRRKDKNGKMFAQIKIYSSYGNSTMEFLVDYCPWCGRKLGTE
ncbi:hypothetical protein PT287_07715 [Lactobacillus sp. ESL0679]|uniref:hypothetical protein n=1 Tax=Lactobacillus sp. ESL0679 TaxID=2983209 RepID=UPI0023F639E0|nr:hypothetical protein [Lactobacillus sp. ESL0679]MDF7683387.1 hypothetical protein [Lactobacillus sp. ESL0679]